MSGLVVAPVIEPLETVVGRVERAYLIAALRAHGGRREETAEALGVSRKTLWQKARAHRITDAEIAAGRRKSPGEVLAEGAVLEAGAVLADELEQCLDPDDEAAVAFVAAVKAWREAQKSAEAVTT